MKFRKKPIIIDAEQWNGQAMEGVKIKANGVYGYIETLEGGYIVDKGDWVITGIAGEKYPCKPDIFENTYEKVENIEEKIEDRKVNPYDSYSRITSPE